MPTCLGYHTEPASWWAVPMLLGFGIFSRQPVWGNAETFRTKI